MTALTPAMRLMIPLRCAGVAALLALGLILLFAALGNLVLQGASGWEWAIILALLIVGLLSTGAAIRLLRRGPWR